MQARTRTSDHRETPVPEGRIQTIGNYIQKFPKRLPATCLNVFQPVREQEAWFAPEEQLGSVRPYQVGRPSSSMQFLPKKKPSRSVLPARRRQTESRPTPGSSPTSDSSESLVSHCRSLDRLRRLGGSEDRSGVTLILRMRVSGRPGGRWGLHVGQVLTADLGLHNSLTLTRFLDVCAEHFRSDCRFLHRASVLGAAASQHVNISLRAVMVGGRWRNTAPPPNHPTSRFTRHEIRNTNHESSWPPRGC